MVHTLELDEGFSLRYPAGWSPDPQPFANASQLVRVPSDEASPSARMGVARVLVTTERKSDHPEAVRRLKEIEAEVDAPAHFSKIDGWPALTRRYTMPMERPGQTSPESDRMSLRVTVAIAAGPLVVRFQGALQPGDDPAIADEIEAIAKSAVFPQPAPP